MASLIDTTTRQWNEKVVYGLSAQEEADAVMKIPLPRIAKEDVLFWPFSSDGEYSCKLGYKFLKEEADQNFAQSQPSLDSQLWKGI